MIKKKIKIAIDSPAAAGAGTVAKALSKYFNLFYLINLCLLRLIELVVLAYLSSFLL